MENKKMRIVFYQCALMDNGIEIELDKDDEPILSTLKGFGDFEDVKYCNYLSELYDYIEENIKYCRIYNSEREKIYTPWLECLKLQQSIIKAALNGEPMTEEEKEKSLEEDWANFEVKRMREEEILGG